MAYLLVFGYVLYLFLCFCVTNRLDPVNHTVSVLVPYLFQKKVSIKKTNKGQHKNQEKVQNKGKDNKLVSLPLSLVCKSFLSLPLSFYLLPCMYPFLVCKSFLSLPLSFYLLPCMYPFLVCKSFLSLPVSLTLYVSLPVRASPLYVRASYPFPYPFLVSFQGVRDKEIREGIRSSYI